MDAGRYRLRPVRGRFRFAHRPNAGRSACRCRAVGAIGRRRRHRGDLCQRAGLRDASGISDGAVGRSHSGAGELRPRPGHGGDQPWPGRSRRGRRATGAQRPLCLRSATASRPPQWVLAGIFSRRAPSLSSPSSCWSRRCSRCVRSLPAEIDPERAHGAMPRPRADKPPTSVSDMFSNRPLLIFAGCLLLFHLANAAMLPLMGSAVTMRSARWATLLIAACIVVPQLLVATLSPWIGQQAQIWGRRPLVAHRLRRLAGSRHSVCVGHRSAVAGHRAIARRRDRRRIQRDGAAHRRRPHARHRAFQSRSGFRRDLRRNRRLAQRNTGGLHQRPFRQPGGFCRAWRQSRSSAWRWCGSSCRKRDRQRSRIDRNGGPAKLPFGQHT